MEVYPKSSWFLLLLGFSLLTATLQESGNCPTSDQVSCTTGEKCNSDKDCDKHMLCCANSCYSKRCTPVVEGVQSEAQSDGPSESECRPYIERALKELETGEAPIKQGSSETGDSAEEIPTVEVTDDSSRQETDIEDDKDEDESSEVAKESIDSGETENIDEHSSEQEGSQEAETKQEQEEQSTEKTEDEGSPEAEIPSIQKEELDELASKEESQEEDAAKEEVEKQEDSEETADTTDSKESQESSINKENKEDVADDKEEANKQGDAESVEEAEDEGKETEGDKEHSEEGDENEEADSDSIEDQPKGEEEQAESNESVAEDEKIETESKEDGVESKEETLESKEETIVDQEQAAERSEEESENKEESADSVEEKLESAEDDVKGTIVESKEEEGKSKEESESVEGDDDKKESVESKEETKDESDEAIKDETKEVESTEVDKGASKEESIEDEESAEKTEENVSESKEESSCPQPIKVSCKEGLKCGTNVDCSKTEICCPNSCYTKRCIPISAIEDSEEEAEEKPAKPLQAGKDVSEEQGEAEDSEESQESNCPPPENVSCKDGEKCGGNSDCKDEEICCPNKCYRKICVPEVSETADEESEEEDKVKAAKSAEKVKVAEEDQSAETEASAEASASKEESDCPPPNELSCTQGERCSSDNDCRKNEICCPNHCYRKRCVPSLSGDETESSEEERKEIETIKEKAEQKLKEIRAKEKKIIIEKPAIKKIEIKKVEIKKPEIKKVEKRIEREIKQDDDEISIEQDGESTVEDLSLDIDIPTELRPRDHVEHLLKLDEESSELENIINRVSEVTLKELKKLYEHAIKPLEVLYKYRDLSNRHFGDSEIFSKPLILFMGPWSGGKSSIINYLVNNEYNETALRTGAEPSPAYFNILMYGDESEVIDGTELAADFTFSGLQKFGQGLEERLRGVKLPNKLLEKVNIVEIPGILEVRKQVSRVFPFNDACQWFIDRADIIFLVYDPSKLDVGPETEAILDQLKGREHQTRIILNKADQVKPEELMRVQGALIWNISPLMSSPQPPVMYTTSLWSRPYEPWAPVRLLQAQERAFLRDLRTAVVKRIENKIASARRFAVRVRNHAKMVDCYLTTYYNHKSVFGNRKQVADEIIEHPQDYHIYEGLSTLTNISRYDLPDPEVYKDFFKLNPLYDFQQLSATCTYFRGCPINRLDIAIAYDLPELVGNHKRHVEEAITKANEPEDEQPQTPGS